MMEEDAELKQKVMRAGVTTISKLVVGEDVCRLKPWYEKRHPEEAPPPGPELANWQLNHTEVVTKIVDSLQGGDVERETWISTDNPPLIGKTDVTHRIAGEFHIYEAKSGRKSNAHVLQLLMYIYMARKSQPGLDGSKIVGHLVYPDQETTLTEQDVPQDLERKMEPHIRAILGPEAPRAVKNPACRWCWADCQFAGKRSQVKSNGTQG
jgi:CRISPR/Cas system-associated exonuclease Cas4 (RecB family)